MGVFDELSDSYAEPPTQGDFEDMLLSTFEELTIASEVPMMLFRNLQMTSVLVACAKAFKEVYDAPFEQNGLALRLVRANFAKDLDSVKAIEKVIVSGLSDFASERQSRINFIMYIFAPEQMMKSHDK